MKNYNSLKIFIFILFPLILEYGFTAFYESATWYAVFFCVIKAAVLCIPFILFPSKIKKLAYFMYAFLYFPALINMVHLILFQSSLSECSLFSMFETTIGESLDFLTHFYDWKLLIFSIFYLSAPLIFIKFKISESASRNFSLNKIQKALLAFICLAGYLAFACGDGRYRYPFERVFWSYIKYRIELNERIQLRDNRKNFHYNNIKSVIQTDRKQTYIFVIGESVDKKHMSLYGYPRKTTPNLDNIKDELYVFKNVNSAFCQTNEVMKCVLLFDQDFKKGDIISFLNEAGFKTFWFSNQYTSGRCDSTACLVGNQASDFAFINRSHFRVNKTSSLDENLLKYLDIALEDKSDKKVIFLHLIGSHSVYNRRYPKEFDLFTNPDFTQRANKVAEYDNSIAYTDSILIKIINRLKKFPENPSVFIYLPDHGEDAYDNDTSSFSHVANIASSHMFDVPLIVWVSEGFKNLRKDYLEGIDISKKYKTDVMIHSILDMFGLEHELIKKEYSVFRQN